MEKEDYSNFQKNNIIRVNTGMLLHTHFCSCAFISCHVFDTENKLSLLISRLKPNFVN